jgi:hypothetical protein
MPIFRIVYIDDDTFAPRTLTAAFANRAAAEIAMAKHGHRVAHMAELGAGENGAAPVQIEMTGGQPGAALPAPARHGPGAAPRRLLRRLRDDLTGVATVLGIVVVGAVLLIF